MLFRFFVFIFCLLAFAQTIAQERIYLNQNFEICEEANAEFYRIFGKVKKEYTVATFWMNDSLFSAQRYNNFEELKLEGPSQWYYKNGVLKKQANYKYDKPVGLEIQYHYNGQIKEAREYIEDSEVVEAHRILTFVSNDPRFKVESGNGTYQDIYRESFEARAYASSGEIKNGLREGTWEYKDSDGQVGFVEVYKNGNLISGKRLTDEHEVKYSAVIEKAHPVPGFKKYYRAIAELIGYPPRQSSGSSRIEETIVTKFIISPNGQASGFQVVNRIDQARVQATLYAFQQHLVEWNPKKVRGRAVVDEIVIPLVFKVNVRVQRMPYLGSRN